MLVSGLESTVFLHKGYGDAWLRHCWRCATRKAGAVAEIYDGLVILGGDDIPPEFDGERARQYKN